MSDAFKLYFTTPGQHFSIFTSASRKESRSQCQGQDRACYLRDSGQARGGTHAVVGDFKAFPSQLTKHYRLGTFFFGQNGHPGLAGVTPSLEEPPASSPRERHLWSYQQGAPPVRQHPQVICSIADPRSRVQGPGCLFTAVPNSFETLYSSMNALKNREKKPRTRAI